MADAAPPTVLIGLSNPKSPDNVGGVMRAAGCYGVEQVRYTGQRYARAVQFHMDTKNAADKIPLIATESLVADLPVELKIVCVELAEGALPLPSFTHPRSALYLFGPEDGSLSQEVLDQADYVVYVPTTGCMNLVATVNVVLYDRLAKNLGPMDHRAQVLNNRDVNNRLVVKKRPS